MIDLRVPGHAEPEQSREEIARLLKEYGVGAVCLLRDGGVGEVSGVMQTSICGKPCTHYSIRGIAVMARENDIIRVFPPGTRLRVTVEVVE